ncbi:MULTISPECIES: hypothetical protein [unclassified Achromobacter]|uniref:hypothetical protein n=1 Tax=unclassified Achromobacter TaxID=2626865 RepID=UPI001E5315D4|nr:MULTISPECIES: hypothetical protein [unclassified Achromobacter]
MSIPVVADADTLFAATTRALLIYLDYEGLIKLHWSPLILDEMSRALMETGRKKTLEDAKLSAVRIVPPPIVRHAIAWNHAHMPD